jgi:hypothetical protein
VTAQNRVEVARLRDELREYYAADGQGDPIRVGSTEGHIHNRYSLDLVQSGLPESWRHLDDLACDGFAECGMGPRRQFDRDNAIKFGPFPVTIQTRGPRNPLCFWLRPTHT